MSGKKKGLKMENTLIDLRSVRTVEEVEPAPVSALEYLQSIYRNPSEPEGRRLRAAMAALQFESPRLGVIATTNINERDFARLLDRAIERSNGVREVKEITRALPKPE
jgi:hypothetical protein